jgi:hypothetical protein
MISSISIVFCVISRMCGMGAITTTMRIARFGLCSMMVLLLLVMMMGRMARIVV